MVTDAPPIFAPLPDARRMAVRRCHACGLTDRPQPGGRISTRCPRCRMRLHERKPDSLSRTWAWLIAAAILYIPANLLPIMHTGTLLMARDDTILSGIAVLWNNGAWDLALIVFVASIVVPLAKIASLAFLLVGVQRRSCWHPEARTRLYRVVDFIGHWSMLDVLVVSLLTAVVQFGGVAEVRPRAGVVAFAAVVILTMFASMSFDPRLIWDAAVEEGHDAAPAGEAVEALPT